MCTGCINGYYEVNLDCTQCYGGCTTCKGSAYNCSACAGGYFLEDNSCIETCPEGKFQDTSTGSPLCTSCNAVCKTCSGSAATDCVTCADGWYLVGGECTVCNPACASCTGPAITDCISCANGTYLDHSSNLCSPCDPLCAVCSGPSDAECSTCSAGAYIKGTKCYKECPDLWFADSTTKTCRACAAEMPNL